MTIGDEMRGMDDDVEWATDSEVGCGLPEPHELPGIFIRQKSMPFFKKYWINTVSKDEDAGASLAYVEQRKDDLKDEIDFFRDCSRTMKLFSVRSRKAVGMVDTFDVYDQEGYSIGIFRKDAAGSPGFREDAAGSPQFRRHAAGSPQFRRHAAGARRFRKDLVAAVVNSTWHLHCPEFVANGRQRSQRTFITQRSVRFVPVAGRSLEIIPWQFHFDFYTPDETLVMSDKRQLRFRDRYLITLPPAPDGKSMDWRVAAALGVALDALQGR